MKKVIVFMLAVLFALPLAASAFEIAGEITGVESDDHSFVLADGTRLWATDDQISSLKQGDTVRAAYEEKGGKKMVTTIEVRPYSPFGRFEGTED